MNSYYCFLNLTILYQPCFLRTILKNYLGLKTAWKQRRDWNKLWWIQRHLHCKIWSARSAECQQMVIEKTDLRERNLMGKRHENGKYFNFKMDLGLCICVDNTLKSPRKKKWNIWCLYSSLHLQSFKVYKSSYGTFQLQYRRTKLDLICLS